MLLNSKVLTSKKNSFDSKSNTYSQRAMKSKSLPKARSLSKEVKEERGPEKTSPFKPSMKSASPSKSSTRPPFNPVQSCLHFPESKFEEGCESVDPLLESNTMLLATPSEEDIAQKFLLTREVDEHISNVEAEIRLLYEKQSKTKEFIKNVLIEVKEREQEIKDAQENLALIYDASVAILKERKVSQNESKYDDSVDEMKDKSSVDKGSNNRLKLITVEELERENTKKKEVTYDPTHHQQEFQKRNESYIPGDMTVNNPTVVLEKVTRMEYLWERLRAYTKKVGRSRLQAHRKL